MKFLLSLILILSSASIIAQDSLSKKEMRKLVRHQVKLEREAAKQAEVDKINTMILARRWCFGNTGNLCVVGDQLYIGFEKYKVTKYAIEKRGDFVELQLSATGTGGTIGFTLSPSYHSSTITFKNLKGDTGIGQGFGEFSTERNNNNQLNQISEQLYTPEEAAFIK